MQFYYKQLYTPLLDYIKMKLYVPLLDYKETKGTICLYKKKYIHYIHY